MPKNGVVSSSKKKTTITFFLGLMAYTAKNLFLDRQKTVMSEEPEQARKLSYSPSKDGLLTPQQEAIMSEEEQIDYYTQIYNETLVAGKASSMLRDQQKNNHEEELKVIKQESMDQFKKNMEPYYEKKPDFFPTERLNKAWAKAEPRREKLITSKWQSILRKKGHPVVGTLLKGNRIIAGQKINIVNEQIETLYQKEAIPTDKRVHTKDGKLPKSNNTMIFVSNHIDKNDIPIIAEVVNKQFYLLSGDFENLYGKLPEIIFMTANGTIYFNMNDYIDRSKVKQLSEKTLENAINMMWEVEGSWNNSQNKPVGYLPFGIMEVILNLLKKGKEVDIIPFGIHRENGGKKYHVAIGKIFSVKRLLPAVNQKIEKALNGKKITEKEYEKRQKISLINTLRNVLATLVWNVWETLPEESRENLDDAYWEDYLGEILGEWNFTEADLEQKKYVPNDIVSLEQVFEPIKKTFTKQYIKKNHKQ